MATQEEGEGIVSDVGTKMSTEDDLDRMVEKASVPNLGSLFRQAKEKGLIKPGKEYTSEKT